MSVLRAHQLSVGHGRRIAAAGIDFELRKGEVLAILGPNGAGKTTLFKTILGLLDPRAGRMELGGVDLRKWPRRRMAKHIAYVPQAHSVAFSYTCFEMVLVGRTAHVALAATPSAEDFRLAENALADLDITHLRDRTFRELSGGEQQMVLIARALAQGAEFLLMDEPTASLDFNNRVNVLKIVRKLAKGNKGVIFSTQDPNHAFHCESVLLLAHREVIAFGSPKEVMTEENLKSVYGIDLFVTTLAENNGTICVPY